MFGQCAPMRALLIAFFVAGLWPAAAAAGDPHGAQACLSQDETREAVAKRSVVSPVSAIRSARAATGGAEIIRARLCRHEGGLVYQIATLRKDGKVQRVTIDGASGKVGTIR